MKKNVFDFVKFLSFLFVVFAVFLLTGCNGVLDSSADKTETVSVSFGVDSSSRALHVDMVSDYEIGNLYWAYTATHKSGLHYIGESEALGVSGDTGTDGEKAGGYKLKPVRRGAVKGLGIVDDKFSRGNWTFNLYGYTGYDESTGVFSGLVYTGTTFESEVSLYTPSLYTPQFTDGFVAVNFVLTEFTGTGTGRTATEGKLVVAPLTFTIPDDMVLYSGKYLCAELADAGSSGSPDRKLYCDFPMTQTLRAGEKVVLPFANVTGFDGKWETGSTDGEVLLSLNWKLWVEDRSTTPATTGDTLAEGIIVDVPVRAGASTFLYGDIDDVARQSTRPAPTSLMEPVCYTGTPGTNSYKEWMSLAEAINAGSDSNDSNFVYLLRDVNNGGVVYKAATIGHNGYSVSNLVWGADKSIVVSKAVGTEGRTCEIAFKAGDIVSFAVGKDENRTIFFDVWSQSGAFATSSGCKNMYITGYCNTVNIVSANNSDTAGKLNKKLGVHFYGDCDTFRVRCNNPEYIELGPDTNITTFTCMNGSSVYVNSVLEAHPTTKVGNLALDWEFNSKDAVKGTDNSLLVPVTFDANSESVYPGGLVNSASVKGSCTGTETVYWIKGIPISVTSAFLSNFKMTSCKSATQKTALGFKTFRDSEDGVPVSGSNYFTGAVSIPCNGPMTLYAYYSNYHLYAQLVSCLGGNTKDGSRDSRFNTGYTIVPNTGIVVYSHYRFTNDNSVTGYRALCGTNFYSEAGASSNQNLVIMFYPQNITASYCTPTGRKSITMNRGTPMFLVGNNHCVPYNSGTAGGAVWRNGDRFFAKAGVAEYQMNSTKNTVSSMDSTNLSVGKPLWMFGVAVGTDAAESRVRNWIGDIGQTLIYAGEAETSLQRHFVPCVLRVNIATGCSATSTADSKGTAGMWDIKNDKFYKSSTSTAFQYRKFQDGDLLSGVAY